MTYPDGRSRTRCCRVFGHTTASAASRPIVRVQYSIPATSLFPLALATRYLPLRIAPVRGCAPQTRSPQRIHIFIFSSADSVHKKYHILWGASHLKINVCEMCVGLIGAEANSASRSLARRPRLDMIDCVVSNSQWISDLATSIVV